MGSPKERAAAPPLFHAERKTNRHDRSSSLAGSGGPDKPVPPIRRWVAPHPGSGGVLLAAPDDFVVEEELAYPLAGRGDHICVQVEKRGLTTPEAAKRLAAAVGIRPHEVSWAGLKDRHATATQWLSFPWPRDASLPLATGAESDAWVVRDVARHERKLKVGHLRSNRFSIRIRDVPPGGFERAQEILDALQRTGIPNAFGRQRFGRRQDNVQQAQDILRKKRRPPKNRATARLLMSALQAHAFNRQLELRIERGLARTVLTGDIMYKHDPRGGMFEVTEPDVDQPRLDRLEISHTGLLPGAKPWRAQGVAGELEREAEAELGLSAEDFSKLGRGVRRTMRWPLDPQAELLREDDTVYRLVVRLPSGAYATVLLDLLVQPANGPLERVPPGPAE